MKRIALLGMSMIPLLGSGTAARALDPPWSVGGTVDVEDVASLVIEGAAGAQAGYDLAVVDWDGDGAQDLLVSEPWADVDDPTLGMRHDAGRIGVFYGPLTAANLGAKPGAPFEVMLDDADTILVGPAEGLFGRVLLASPAGEDGPTLAVAVPGAVGLDPIPQVWTSLALHGGEVWLLEGGDPVCHAAGLVDAADCEVGRLWWDGEMVYDDVTFATTVSGPQDFGYELTSVPDLDGDGWPELAVSAATFIDYLIGGDAEIVDGEVLVIPGSRVISGDVGAVTQGWRIGGALNNANVPVFGHALIGGQPDSPLESLAIGNLPHEDFLGCVSLLDGSAFGPVAPQIEMGVDAGLDSVLDALVIEGTGSDVGLEYLLGMDAALVAQGEWMAVSALGHRSQPDQALHAVTELIWLPHALWEYGTGDAVSAEELDPWSLVGDENPITALENNIELWIYLVALYWDHHNGLTTTLAEAETCALNVPDSDPVEVSNCLLPFVRALSFARPLMKWIPRSGHVYAPLGDDLVLGETIYDDLRGALYVVEMELDAGPGAVIALEPLVQPPAGWTITRVEFTSPVAWFGHTLASPGDLDGDGVPDLAIGAPAVAGSEGSDETGDSREDAPGRAFLLLSADYTDSDGDGLSVADGDCDDANALRFPGNPEVCDGLDNDCNDDVDDGLVFDDWFPDADGDDHGDGAAPRSTCSGPPSPSWVAAGDDCDDGDAAVYPGAPEACDRLDNDCDGSIPPAETDEDADGIAACEGDCDDTRDDVYPGAAESCDDADNSCNGLIDDGVTCPQGCGCTDAGRPVAALRYWGPVLGLLCVWGGRRVPRRRDG